MAVLPPPVLVWQRVESRVPGVYNRFLRAVHSTGAIAATSWYRDPVRNRVVGGASQSQHLLGLAADLIPRPGVGMHQLAEAARAAGLVAVPYDRHVHVQAWTRGTARQLRLI